MMRIPHTDVPDVLFPMWGEGIGLGQAHMWNRPEIIDGPYGSLCGKSSPTISMGVSMKPDGMCMECVKLDPNED